MIKEFLNQTLELESFVKSHETFQTEVIEKRNYLLQKELRKKKSFSSNFGHTTDLNNSSKFTNLQKAKIVIDVLVGDISVERICRRERISYETFLSWKEKFLEAFRGYSESLILKERIARDNKIKIIEQGSEELYDFFKKYAQVGTGKNLVIPKGEELSLYSNFYRTKNAFVFKRINDFRKINKHLEEVNRKIPYGGILFGCFETFQARAKRKKFPKLMLISHISFAFDFIFKRVIPKLPLFKQLYFGITKGKNRLLSKAEVLGRLVSCGFEIIEVKPINGLHYFAVKKVNKPEYNMNPSYGPLFKMNRVGKDGKIIGVYKFRTMHPYSEYLQDYVLKLNGYAKSGKPADDFRLVPWGKFLRRYWLDELPQLINVIKGEMKLVGIRPVSKRYFQDIPTDIQQMRLTQKPGCIPPYVALNRTGAVNDVIEAEKQYLQEKIRNPYFTDTRYFFKAIYNIFLKNKRSA